MRGSEDLPDVTPAPPKSKSTVVLLFGTIADTTWRMFVPVIGLLMLGYWVDHSLGTLPWGILLFTVVGIAVAGELIKRQLKNVKK